MRAVTVWHYMSTLGDANGLRLTKRLICFLAGSIEYNGDYLRCSDSVWIVPNTIVEEWEE